LNALDKAVRAARRGDDEAFRAVYRAVHPGLVRYLRYLVADDADDVASETWLQVVRDLASFSGDGDAFRRWVTMIARHRALDHLRGRRRRPAVPVPVEDLFELAGGVDPASAALDAIATRTALALIATLPRDQAEAVLLRVVVGLDARGAARVLGKRPGAVRTAAHRGLRELDHRLARAVAAARGVTDPRGSALKETR